MNIALVDDNESEMIQLRDFLSQFEKQNGLSFSVDYFSSGELFLESFAEYKYSIIFIDVFMDGINGAETARLIREKDQFCLIIFLTSSDAFMSEAFSCYAFEYIQKPATRERVFQVLADALKLLPRQSRLLEFICSRQTVRLLYSDIVCVVARGHNTDVTDIRGCTQSPYIGFSEFIRPLNTDDRFLLLNKGVLVNMDHISGFDKNVCHLACGIQLPVRVRESSRIERLWQDYTFAQIHARMSRGGKKNDDL